MSSSKQHLCLILAIYQILDFFLKVVVNYDKIKRLIWNRQDKLSAIE
jgi:hypothetical protein